MNILISENQAVVVDQEGNITVLDGQFSSVEEVKAALKAKKEEQEIIRKFNLDILPEPIKERIELLKSYNKDLKPIVNFFSRLAKNPDPSVRDRLYDFLNNVSIVIDNDGFIIAYKAVKDDFYDIYSGTIKYEVGKVIEISRDECDPDPSHACSRGLHVGSYHYAEEFARTNNTTTILEVKVDPKDVVAVPYDYSAQKCRVCRLKVVKVCKQPKHLIDAKTLPDKITINRKPYKRIKKLPKDVELYKVRPSKVPVALKPFKDQVYRSKDRRYYEVVVNGKSYYYEVDE